MSEEEVRPDFDIGIIGGNSEQDVWHSKSESRETTPASESNMGVPDLAEQGVNSGAQKKLRRLLKIPGNSSNVKGKYESDSDHQHLSSNRSRSGSRLARGSANSDALRRKPKRLQGEGRKPGRSYFRSISRSRSRSKGMSVSDNRKRHLSKSQPNDEPRLRKRRSSRRMSSKAGASKSDNLGGCK